MLRLRATPLVACVVAGLSVHVICSPRASAQTSSVTAGGNMEIDFNEELPVSYSSFVGAYFIDVELIHDPGAGPMIQRFETPTTDTNNRILLDAAQPAPQLVWGDYRIAETSPGGPPISEPVHGWYAEIMTEGWEWVLPDDPGFPSSIPLDDPLITRDDVPHPASFPAPGAEPHEFWVEFPPVNPGETLGIHKALLWVGTTGNSIWGDDLLDDGTPFNESLISVWAHPTVPEPSTWAMLLLGAIFCAALRRR